MNFDMGIAFDAEITHCFFGTIEDFLEKYSFKYDLQSGNCVLSNTMGVYVSGLARLRSLGCTVLTADGKSIKMTAFDKTPEYQYLDGNKAAYNTYYSDIAKLDRHNPDKYDKLIQELDNGYDESHVLGVDSSGNMFDGRHRTAYLYKKFGPDYKIRFICPVFTAKSTGML